jgi:putative flippase GtrA
MTRQRPIKRIADWPIFRFAVIGGLGFIIDASVLLFMMSNGLDAYTARILSFAVAVIATWWGNRTWTFRNRIEQPNHKEFCAYLLVQAFGTSINYAVYALCLYLIGTAPLQALLALACGSTTALFFNFYGARTAVFQVQSR